MLPEEAKRKAKKKKEEFLLFAKCPGVRMMV